MCVVVGGWCVVNGRDECVSCFEFPFVSFILLFPPVAVATNFIAHIFLCDAHI